MPRKPAPLHVVTFTYTKTTAKYDRYDPADTDPTARFNPPGPQYFDKMPNPPVTLTAHYFAA